METGELMVCNNGTGTEAPLNSSHMRKVPGFNVPREMLPQDPPTKQRCIDANENYSLFSKVQVLTLQEVNGIGRKKRFCFLSVC